MLVSSRFNGTYYQVSVFRIIVLVFKVIHDIYLYQMNYSQALVTSLQQEKLSADLLQ